MNAGVGSTMMGSPMMHPMGSPTMRPMPVMASPTVQSSPNYQMAPRSPMQVMQPMQQTLMMPMQQMQMPMVNQMKSVSSPGSTSKPLTFLERLTPVSIMPTQQAPMAQIQMMPTQQQVYNYQPVFQPVFQPVQRVQRTASPTPPQSMSTDYKYAYGGRYELRPRDEENRILTPSFQSSAPTRTPRANSGRYQSMGHDHSIVERGRSVNASYSGNMSASYSGGVDRQRSVRAMSPHSEPVRNDMQYRAGVRPVSPTRNRSYSQDNHLKVYDRPHDENRARSPYNNTRETTSYERHFSSLYSDSAGRTGYGATSKNGSCVQQ